VEVEVVLLHVLAVVAFAVGQSEEPFLQNRVPSVPERQAEAEALRVVGNAGDAVFAPTISPRTRMIVWKEVPRVAVLAVILAHGSPLSLAQVRSPLLPRDRPHAGFLEPTFFIGHRQSLCHTDTSPAS